MNRSLPSLITGMLLAAALLLYMVTYQVRFTEVAVVRTFGKARAPDPANDDPGDVKTEAGLYWKWPWPIQEVSKYDNRLQVTSTTGEEVPTKDGKNLIITTAVCWRIDEPYWFSIRCADMKDAKDKLLSRVRNDQQNVISSQYKFDQFVSTDPGSLLYDQIEEQIFHTVRDKAKELYGIRVESVSLEKLALPENITENVFEAMRKERQAVAATYTSEGESTARQIKDTAESIAGTIQSFAKREAAEIVAVGLHRAAEYNRTFAQDEDLAKFLIQIENLPTILKERSTVILDAASAGLEPLMSSKPLASGQSTTQPASPKDDQSATGVALPEIVGPK